MTSVIITAGGSSSRFKTQNKLLFEFDGKPVIVHTIEKFIDLPFVNEIVISANLSLIPVFNELFSSNKNVKIIQGGETRQASVFNALKVCTNADYVIIHDGARPFVSKETILKCYETAKVNGAAITAVKTTDTIKIVDTSGVITSTPERKYLWNAQTPQIFKYDLIYELHKKFDGCNYTDDAILCEKENVKVFVVEGEYTNIKITTQADVKNLI